MDDVSRACLVSDPRDLAPKPSAQHEGIRRRAAGIGRLACTRALNLLKYPLQLPELEHLLPEGGQPGCDEPVRLAAGNPASFQRQSVADLVGLA